MRTSARALVLLLALLALPSTARAHDPIQDAFILVGNLFCDGEPNPDGGPCTIWSDTCKIIHPCDWQCSPDPRGTCDAPPVPYLGDYQVTVCEAQFPDCPMNYVAWIVGRLPHSWTLPACDAAAHPGCLLPPWRLP